LKLLKNEYQDAFLGVALDHLDLWLCNVNWTWLIKKYSSASKFGMKMLNASLGIVHSDDNLGIKLARSQKDDGCYRHYFTQRKLYLFRITTVYFSRVKRTKV
jgi:hypothetical protein